MIYSPAEERSCFDRNLRSLAARHGVLRECLAAACRSRGRYQFLDGGNELIPAWAGVEGAPRLLHSRIAPRREAEKLLAAGDDAGYLILLGLGGGFLTEAALERDTTRKIIIIDYDKDSVAELLAVRDYSALFANPRVTLLVDPSKDEIEQYVTGSYHPSLHKGIRVIPLRARCDGDAARFLAAADAVRDAIERVSVDYSTQSCFGWRWFTNITRNLRHAETQCGSVPPVTSAAVCAAGPSLDIQLERLRACRADRYVIATDTALGALFAAGIRPDAVISIDCQHISYLHFMRAQPLDLSGTTLFLDLASPPLLASLAPRYFFFSCGHPLVRYVSAFFRKLPELDSSGANVTYAAVSLAHRLGARHIELYGADFAYPDGLAYTRGAYFYPCFERMQSRFKPVSAQLAAFLFKMPSLTKVTPGGVTDRERGARCYYETRSMVMYRRKLEEKARRESIPVEAVPGWGAPIALAACAERGSVAQASEGLFTAGAARMSAGDFLRGLRRSIEELPLPASGIEEYTQNLPPADRFIWTALLPAIAAFDKKERAAGLAALVQRVKTECIREIDRTLSV